MEDINVKKENAVWRSSRFKAKGSGAVLEKTGIDDILNILSKNGYRSCEGMELCKELELLKKKYDVLIERQNNMPGDDKLAEAVIKYYLLYYRRRHFRVSGASG